MPQRGAETGAEAASAAVGRLLSRETIKMAARNGIGALTFAFRRAGARPRNGSTEYYDIIQAEECVPIGYAVNANVALVTGFSVHPDEDGSAAPRARRLPVLRLCARHHYASFGEHQPALTDMWAQFLEKRGTTLPRDAGARCGIGTPDQVRAHLRRFEQAGVDQIVFIQQGGSNRHEHICESLELFAREVMPEFRQREIAREKQKQEELAPYIEKAMARKQAMTPMRDEEIPVYVALGRKINEEGTATERQKQNARLWADAAKVTLSDPARHGTKTSATS